MKVAYSRVSSDRGQETGMETQIEILKKYGVEKVFFETASGTSTKGRVKLKECLEFVREGDEIVITRIDRLARSILDLQVIVKELNDKGVTLTATEQPIDTKTASGKCFLDMLGVFSEFETNLRRERQLEGIKNAKEKGVYKGRTPSVDVEKVKELRDSGMGASAIAKELGIGRASVYRVLDKLD